MKQQTKNKPTRSQLVFVTNHDTAIFYSIVTGDIEEGDCLNDQNTGAIYYMDGGLRNYLPKEFQPRLIIHN